MRWHTECMGFVGDDGTLYGELLTPGGQGPFPGAVLCHGMGVDHRAMRPVAQRLVRKGIATFTFDLRGHGRSDGVVDDNVVHDVFAALRFLRGHARVNPKRIALVGHSFGAWVAILAAMRCREIRALVSISSPGEMGDRSDYEQSSLFRRLTRSGKVFEYPRAGLLPGSRGLAGLLAVLWMRLRGYHARVNWRKALVIGQKMERIPFDEMGDFPKLFVHCTGDLVTPYATALQMYERVRPPKEFLVGRGHHSTPLFPGKLRDRWVDWLVAALVQQRYDGEATDIRVEE